MAEERLIQGQVTETGESIFAVAINISGHELVGDEPIAAGGKNLGPSPYDVLLAALGECTSMTIRWYAQQKNWPLDKVEVFLTHQKQKTEGQSSKIDVFTKKIKLHGPLLDEAQREKLFEVAAKCPVQRTLESTPQIRSEHIA